MQRILTALELAFEIEYPRRRVRALILVQRHAGLSIEDGIILARTGIIEKKNNYRIITDRKKTEPTSTIDPSWVGRELLAAPNGNSSECCI
jgi:hypothetical protein